MPPRSVAAPIPVDAELVQAVVDAVIAWFEAHGRDLPWRDTRDPWAVLVSEVMLQQLRVARTLPFYERFVARFPTPDSLAAATLGEAPAVWGDLGRYRAAAALHRAARIIVADHVGHVPADVDELIRLPGVGPYTAGAVACFALERPVAFLDTNARRVLHRVFVGVDVPRPTAPPSQLRDLAERLVPTDRAWAWNQALIEVGALRCRARSVDCDRCPVSRWCVARPPIAAALAATPRSATVTSRYAGTNRQHRGQVLRVLRGSGDEVVSIDRVGRQLRPHYDESDRAWIDSVVASLERDGLVRRRSAGERRVGEELPAYAVDEEVAGGGDEGISLP